MKSSPIRLSAHQRIARLLGPESPTAAADHAAFSTIAAHLYRGAYFPGTRPDPAADQTRFTARRHDNTLVLELEMAEPSLAALQDWLREQAPGDFFATDFVCLNFLDRQGRVVQAAAKVNSATLVRREGRDLADSEITFAVGCGDNQWRARIEIPLAFLGYDWRDLDSAGVPFDVVRLHSASGATSAWCPIPSQLPFNENYDYPVFCFGMLTNGNLNWEDVVARSADIGVFQYDGAARVAAGSYASFALEYTVGEHGLAPGGALAFNIRNEVIECNWRSRVKRALPAKDWTAPQWDDPRQPGYVDVVCSRAAADFRLERRNVFSVTARLRGDTALRPGDRVRLRLGEHPAGPGFRTQLLAQRNYPLKVYADLVGNGVFLAPEDFPRLDVTGGAAVQLVVFSPPTPDPGESVRLKLVAVDALGNIAEEYAGRVQCHCPVPATGLPPTCAFTAADRGVQEFTVAYQDPGVFQVLARDLDHPTINGASNLIVTDGAFGPGRIYFGDIHTHSQLSDGRLHPEDKYREAAHHRGLDFWALTDHGHDFTAERLEQLRRTIARHNEDNFFATLFGYEWTNSMGLLPRMRANAGHRNIYFREAPRSVHDGVNLETASVQGVHEKYLGEGVEHFCINHFHCGEPDSVKGADRCVEVSGWCGEFNRDSLTDVQARAGSIFDTFDAGIQVGVVAGTDHGTEAYYTGLPAELTAIHSAQLDRDHVFDALRAGHTYGTSGQRTLLRFTVNGQAPGTDNPPIRAKKRLLQIVIGTIYPVQAIQVIRNRKVWQSLAGFEYGVQTYTLADEDRDPPRGYYLVRIFTAQGHTTWSSPIFFES
ncbi:MAG: hypothetical protein K9N49_09825 [Candidatus Marinimicrobia bacterium]|nr:hypothetical protein [Candidatus Neomarinimicrobiota bacterium]